MDKSKKMFKKMKVVFTFALLFVGKYNTFIFILHIFFLEKLENTCFNNMNDIIDNYALTYIYFQFADYQMLV